MTATQKTGTPAGGRPRIDPEFVRSFQRRRIETALAALTREQGYRATTVSHVVSRAGIARNTFYENFPSKEGAFLSLLRRGFEEVEERVGAACGEAAPGSDDPLRAALEAVLDWAADDRDGAHACLIEAPCGGGEALRLKSEAEDHLAGLLCGLLPSTRRTRPVFAELAGGGLVAVLASILLHEATTEGVTGRLDDLTASLEAAIGRPG